MYGAMSIVDYKQHYKIISIRIMVLITGTLGSLFSNPFNFSCIHVQRRLLFEVPQTKRNAT
jgi:hypothetical protein